MNIVIKKFSKLTYKIDLNLFENKDDDLNDTFILNSFDKAMTDVFYYQIAYNIQTKNRVYKDIINFNLRLINIKL